jgi:threonine dehydrogenase-like Zn-dependent dehydrogenase
LSGTTDILGHEPMGVVVEVGSDVKKLEKGDRVVAPFVIACGERFFCKKGLFSCCDNSNPNAKLAESSPSARR